MTPEILKVRRNSLEFSVRSLGQGPAVIMLHGYPDGPQTFEYQQKMLADQGYRVFCPTLRGYEPTSQPADHQYLVLDLVEDLLHSMDQLEIKQAHLVGHDWGATIAYAAAAHKPERWLSLLTMAVPHPGRFSMVAKGSFRQLWNSRYIFFYQLKGVAERKIRRNNFDYIRALWKKWSPSWTLPEVQMNELIAQLAQPGVIEAALSYYRGAIDRSPRGIASNLLLASPIQVATRVIHGADDRCIDSKIFSRSLQLEDFPAGLDAHLLPRTGHFPHLEKPTLVAALIHDWIQRFPAN